MPSKSKRYYDNNPEAKKKKKRYDTKYQSSDEQKKRRASRNAARRKMKGKVGKGQDVDHRDSNPLNNSKSNLRVRSQSANRGDKR